MFRAERYELNDRPIFTCVLKVHELSILKLFVRVRIYTCIKKNKKPFRRLESHGQQL